MDRGILGLLLFVSFFIIGFAWYLFGRAVCLLILNEFIWKDFVRDWKDFESEDVAETLLYIFFPFTILYFGISRIKF